MILFLHLFVVAQNQSAQNNSEELLMDGVPKWIGMENILVLIPYEGHYLQQFMLRVVILHPAGSYWDTAIYKIPNHIWELKKVIAGKQ